MRPLVMIARGVQSLSAGILFVERWTLMGLMALLTGLILLNVVTRYAGVPIYWVDEASVYAMVWLTFVGASAMTRLKMDFAVTLLTEKLSGAAAHGLSLLAGAGVLAFGIALVIMCLLWMDPLGIARAGFDAQAYAADSFNFLYTERSQTLNWPMWVIQLVLPIFAVTLCVHALANLLEECRWVPRRPTVGFQLASAEMVN